MLEVLTQQMLDFNFFLSIPLANVNTSAKLLEFQQKVRWGLVCA
jgi:hypothetical protein